MSERYTDPIFQVIDIYEFDTNQTWEAMTQGGSDDLDRVIYTDTDSSFIRLFELFQAYFDKSEEEFKKIVMEFSEESVKQLGIDKQTFIDLITEVTDFLGDYVNKKILVDFKNKYGIDDEYNHLDFKGEFIFSAIYILMKKVYGYRQIAEKGVIDEKFASSNLGVKSDKAEITNKVILNLLKLILTQPTLQPVIAYTKKYIQQFRQMIRNRDIRVAIPASINKPIDEYETNGEVPRAALIFEYITNNRGYIRPGTKGKLYVINNIKWNKIKDAKKIQKELADDLRKRWGIKDVRSALNVIFIPEAFEDKFDYDLIEINEDAQLVKVLLKPLDQLFRPLGINIADLADVDKKLFK